MPIETDRETLLAWNHTAKSYPWQPLPQLVEAQVAKTPHHPAVVVEGEQWDYHSLNQQANQLAHYLQQQGIQPDSLVGICLERSFALMVGLLAIVKAGGAYVPLEPSHPTDRLALIHDDAQLSLILTTKTLLPHLPLAAQKNALCLDSDTVLWQSQSSENPTASLDLHHLAYVIYTSGSTGQPKGAMNSHLAISNRLLWMQDRYQLTAEDRVLQKTPFSFDVSVWEFFWPLIAGATLVFAKPGGHQDPHYLHNLLHREGITTLHFVPSMLHLFLSENKGLQAKNHQDNLSLRQVFCSGEALSVDLQNRFFSQFPNVALYNLYGPTEAAVDVSHWSCQPDTQATTVPIGRPISNLQLFVMDEALNLLPIGEEGELLIGGVGLARGYLNRSALTAEKFVTAPTALQPTLASVFDKVPATCRPPADQHRLYKTGDLARFNADGALEFLGRFDHQIKIRGLRIELGEIEQALRQHPAISEAVVTAQQQRLTAYLLPEPTIAYPIHQLLQLEQQGQLADQRRYELPNGYLIFHHNKPETDFIYQEIFEEKTYFKQGISLPPHACVFDVGANIGLFSLFIHQQAPDAQIYAFEPLPPIFQTLKLNCQLHNIAAHCYPYGLAETSKTVNFTYYPHATLISGRFADAQTEKATLQAYLSAEAQPFSQAVLEEALVQQSYECSLTTLSQIIAENQINRIDLLKIDVEKSEYAVLQGIHSEDWPKIQQIVIEVHDENNRLATIHQQLLDQGFECFIEYNNNLATVRGRRIEDGEQAGELQELAVNESDNQWHSPQRLIQALRHQLHQQLPDYMVPSHFILLPQFPLTTSGKVDRKALPSPAFAQRQFLNELTSAATPLQQQLVQLWQQLLDFEPIGIHDNFFQLGGHSLIAVQLLLKLREVDIDLPLHSVFAAPTIAELAQFIQQTNLSRLPPVQPVAETQRVPLSYPQQQQWFISQLAPEKPIYNEPLTIYYQGILNLAALEQAINYILQRHNILRSYLVSEEGITYQVVTPFSPLRLMPKRVTESQAIEFAQQQAQKPFSLTGEALLRIALLQTSEVDYQLQLTVHHILIDGVSFYQIFLPELQAAYTAYLTDKEPELSPLPFQYRDFAHWQHQHFNPQTVAETPHLVEQLHYWQQRLQDVPRLQLPTDYPPSGQPDFAGAQQLIELPPSLSMELKAFSQQRGVTLFMTLLSAFAVLLMRYSGQSDFAIGTVSGMRQSPGSEKLIGLFLNTLALRLDFSPQQTFLQLLQRVQTLTTIAYQHQTVPFSQIVEKCHPQRQIGENPFFQVMFDLDPLPTVSDNRWQASHFTVHTNTAKFDLTLELYETEQQITGRFEYRTALFKPSTIARLANHYRTLLTGLLQTPEKPIYQLPLITRIEWQQFQQWQQATLAPPVSTTVPALFAAQAEATPEAVALIFGEQQWTYRQLQQYSQQLAHYLQQQGVKTESLVGVCLPRSFELIVSLLAILQAGGAYVPVDTQWPKTRIAWLIEDTALQWLLTFSELAVDLPTGPAFVCLDQLTETLAAQSIKRFDLPLKPNHLAYILYTSGSTGVPKGVSVEHRGIVRLVKETNYLPFSAQQRFLQLAPIHFDASTLEIWGSLLNGASLVLAPPENLSLAELGRLLQQQKIKVLWLTAGLFQQMVDHQLPALAGLRYLLAGGDVLSVSAVKTVLNSYPHCTLINGYGPTENTTFSCCYTMQNPEQIEQTVPIGKPITRTQAYVLDPWQQPVPIGIPGELYVGGEGLAREYFHRPKLTAEKFLTLDLFPLTETPQRVYRTGDLVRYLSGGDLEFLGRLDNQVKIRGFRVEPGEIETVLMHQANVKAALVTVEATEQDKQLIAYVIPCNPAEPQQTFLDNLRTTLQQRLPAYMLPGAFIYLTAFPLTANGKIDRQALPKPNLTALAAKAYQPPHTEIEKKLATIWSNLLHVDKLSIHADFFELGGHSLLATQLISRIREQFNLELPLRVVFEASTIETLAQHIDLAQWPTMTSVNDDSEEGEL